MKIDRRTASSIALYFIVPSLSAVAIVAEAGKQISAQTSGSSTRKVVQTFAFFGCNRIDPKDWEETKSINPSSANIPQLSQNLTDISKLAPDTLFFGGDLVMGYADDRGETLRGQMSAWIDLVKKLPHSPKTKYVAISGNHELNRKVGEAKIPNLAADAVWTELVKTAGLIPQDAKGPTPQSDMEDNLVDDQRALSFSFTRGTVHFVVLNTDTRVSTLEPTTRETTKETKIAMVPTQWLNSDLDAAEKNPRILSVVVLGHRNVIDPDSVKGDAPIDAECGTTMVRILQAHPKVRAYVCAHVHAFDISPIGTPNLYQTTFGNGGSSLEKTWMPKTGRTFGFGFFRAYADGSLGVIPYSRPAPKNYLAATPDMVPAATSEPELIIPKR